MGVQIPTTWQGVATQAQISPAQQLATAGVAGAAIPQAAGVVAYPIQQFQVSPQVGNQTIKKQQHFTNKNKVKGNMKAFDINKYYCSLHRQYVHNK